MEIYVVASAIILLMLVFIISKLLSGKDDTESKYQKRNVKIKHNHKTTTKHTLAINNISKPIDDNDFKTHNIILKDAGPEKIQIIKLIREITGFDLQTSKDITDTHNSSFSVNTTKEQLNNFISNLTLLGAIVIVEDQSVNIHNNSSQTTSFELLTYEFILVDAGPNLIQAIKAIRDFTGLGLKEAKDIVDQNNSIIIAKATQQKAEAFLDSMKSIGAKVKQV